MPLFISFCPLLENVKMCSNTNKTYKKTHLYSHWLISLLFKYLYSKLYFILCNVFKWISSISVWILPFEYIFLIFYILNLLMYRIKIERILYWKTYLLHINLNCAVKAGVYINTNIYKILNKNALLMLRSACCLWITCTPRSV